MKPTGLPVEADVQVENALKRWNDSEMQVRNNVTAGLMSHAETPVNPKMEFKAMDGQMGRGHKIKQSLCLLQKTQMKIV